MTDCNKNRLTFAEVFACLKRHGPAIVKSRIGTKYTVEAVVPKGVPMIIGRPRSGQVRVHEDCWGLPLTCHGTRAGGLYNGDPSIYDWYEKNSASLGCLTRDTYFPPANEESQRNMSDCDLVVSAIKRLGSIRLSDDPGWQRAPALKVIDCVLSLNRRYDKFVVPRLDSFEKAHPSVRSLEDLRLLICSYSSAAAFLENALNYRDPSRAATLLRVVCYLIEKVSSHPAASEEESLALWAKDARPLDHHSVGVRGFGLAGFQYMRMLFGADTTKPDVHVCRFVDDALQRHVSAITALDLLERAALLTGVGVRDTDTTIWQRAARGVRREQRKNSQTRCTRMPKYKISGRE